MIDYQEIQNIATKSQTNEENVIREYLQNLFLRSFYRQDKSENFLFKGGTALRLAFESPRFSEDLDFSAVKNGKTYEKILLLVMEAISKEAIDYKLIESKPTSGGWLAILNFNIYGREISIRNEISFRKKKLAKDDKLILPEIIPAYRLVLLASNLLVKEKIQALMSRQKERDFFDLYFILRNSQLRNDVSLTKKQREKLVQILKEIDSSVIEKELKYLVPVSFHPIIKNLPNRLIKELGY